MAHLEPVPGVESTGKLLEAFPLILEQLPPLAHCSPVVRLNAFEDDREQKLQV